MGDDDVMKELRRGCVKQVGGGERRPRLQSF